MMEAILAIAPDKDNGQIFTARVTQAFLNMKKLFNALKRAYEGK